MKDVKSLRITRPELNLVSLLMSTYGSESAVRKASPIISIQRNIIVPFLDQFGDAYSFAF